MANLEGSRSIENLRAALAGESQANRKYTAWSRKADQEGYPEVADLFRSTAEGETAHALGHLRHLGMIKSTRDNLKAAVEGETHECEQMYPEFARVAREEGFEQLAEWFDALAKAERSHANRFQKALDQLD